MSKNTSRNLLKVAKDTDLQERAVAIAAEMGIKSPHYFVVNHILEFASKEVDDDGNTIASVYEYADLVYKQAVDNLPEKPGANPAAVTDAQIRSALENLRASTTD